MTLPRRWRRLPAGIEAGPPADPAYPLRMPGARAARARQEAASSGIVISKPLAEALQKAEAILARLSEGASDTGQAAGPNTTSPGITCLDAT